MASTRLALVVRLERLDVEIVLVGRRLGGGDVVGQRRRAVHLRLTLAEQVEVRPVEQQHQPSFRTPPPR